jgi:hypothetical protein
MWGKFGNPSQYTRRVQMDSYSVQCDRSGFRANMSDCVTEWNGRLVLKQFSEQRHPMDRFRPPREDVPAPVVRSRDLTNVIDPLVPPDLESY